MAEWKPIESAPRDGTWVLICQSHGTDSRDDFGSFVHRAAWWASENDGSGAWIVYNAQPLDPECFFEPTHWMQIPEPPDAR